eukprot:6458719-Amphidinium_carterae.1
MLLSWVPDSQSSKFLKSKLIHDNFLTQTVTSLDMFKETTMAARSYEHHFGKNEAVMVPV